ncbi:50S ribosomal protein L25/general stress protein Ctc [Sphingomonas spermidinifaciens]|uniref:Large ribosomal subunit protein bL25 n=1 Tax=Sphingomonas spermidinifaciens TaxID=1141889 RepID=A0A2A4B2Y2_9SPHN|nr:50S ribosomal protein L25/general stress protein Ctc [Sphingomonas spermidinifaciens]PCD02139.1 50S ribosomal protein L25/general stress protein Ctc [Sphingomonas spermidinifaciens]
MSDTLTLSAETRERVGKGASRALRREGRVPAVIYGNKQEPLSIHVEERALNKLLGTGHFMNSIVMVEGAGKAAIRTLPKDVTFDPVTDRPVHVDFLRIAKNATVTVAVPFAFTDEDEAPGIKKGGVLNIVAHELEVTVDADKIPDSIEVSLKGLEVGDTIHLSAIKLPSAAEATQDGEFTIATIIAPSAMKADVQESLAEADALAEAAAAEQGEPAELDADAESTEGDAEAEDKGE